MIGVVWIFWFSLVVLIYAYLGYPLLLSLLTLFFKRERRPKLLEFPTVTHIVAAYNEEDIIAKKVENSLKLKYPKEKLQNLFVTDGSSDQTPDIVKQHPEIKLSHKDERKGKIAAVERVLPHLNSEILVFSDANTMLNSDAIINLISHFRNEKVGAVAGEKKVISDKADTAAGSGESIYWKYESFIKNCEARIASTVGAAGELYAVKRELLHFPPDAVYVEDMITTLNVTDKGYEVSYARDAIASEYPSANIMEEMKRKIRISARGVRTIPMLLPYLNFFSFGWTSLFLFSHKFLRWIFAPIALLTLFISSIFLRDFSGWYNVTFYAQVLFYTFALIGLILSHKHLNIKILFIPFYFTFTHICTFLGYIQLFRGNTNPLWERSKRKAA